MGTTVLRYRRPVTLVCRYYRFVDRPPGDFADTLRDRPGARHVDTKHKRFTVNVIGDEREVRCIRVDFEVDTHELSEEDIDVVHRCLHHMLSVLRVAYDYSVAFWRGPTMWMFDDLDLPELGFHIQADDTNNDSFLVNYDNIGNVFIGAWGHQKALKYLADSTDVAIPLRYRFLSACQVLEDEFEERGELNTTRLAAFLETNSTLTTGRYLTMRARCAHTAVRGGRVGFLELTNEDARELDKELPEVQRLAGLLLNDRFDGQLTLFGDGWAASNGAGVQS